MSTNRNRPTGLVLDDPAFSNYEFNQRIHESLAIPGIDVGDETSMAMEVIVTGTNDFANSSNDRFLSHERDPTLDENAEDPLDVWSNAWLATDIQWRTNVYAERRTRTAARRAELTAAGIRLQPWRSVWNESDSEAGSEEVTPGQYGTNGQYVRSLNVLSGSSIDDDSDSRFRVRPC